MRILMQMLDWFMSPAANLHYREDLDDTLDFAGLCFFMFFLFVVLGGLL